ncbi:unnamed protein product [Sphagnum jensenii]|uniref:Uncharacterized protein n=1 Tax=Sphagnum jensenii TaxID=128206 RepID=A0ABP1AZN0_9BRYO
MSPRAIAKASFSAHGGKVAIAIFGGEVHVFSGVALTPIDIFSIQFFLKITPALELACTTVVTTMSSPTPSLLCPSVTHGRVMAMLDADFHSLNPVRVQYYGPAMDKIKCQILEGVEAADVQVLVLDMQGWLMLDMLGVE